MTARAGERTGDRGADRSRDRTHDRGGDPWPRDFGRDGVSGLITADRALRARDVSRPGVEDERLAEQAIEGLLSRLDGRR